MDILRFIIALFLPPLGVLLEVGFTKHFFINVILTVLGYLPGIIHAMWIIFFYKNNKYNQKGGDQK